MHPDGQVDLVAERSDGVLTLTLNRPKTLNSLSPELMDALTAALDEARDDDAVRCVVLTGTGRAFSSGAELGADPDDLDVRGLLRRHYGPTIRAITTLDKPVVASLRGMAAGAGASLALACDFRIAADDARLALLFVRIGLVPDAGASYFLTRMIGTARAAELMMLGDPVEADELLRLGLVNRVVPGDALAAETTALATRLARGPGSIGLIKQLVRTAAVSTLDEQFEHEVEAQGVAGDSLDFREGVRAFVEKRPTAFTGH